MKKTGLIKYAVLAVTPLLFAAGCGEKEDDGGGGVFSDGEQAIERLLTQSNPNGARITIDTEHGSGLETKLGNEETFVGYGIKAFGGPTFAEALGPQLFKNEVYADSKPTDGNSYISSSRLNQSAENYVVVRNNLGDVYNGLNFSEGLNVSGDANVPWFSGGVKAQYGDKKTIGIESKYYSYIYSWVTKKHTLDPLYMFGEFMQDILDSNTVTALNDPNTAPKTLFEKLGTHIILSASIGGEANISGLYNSFTSASEDDMKTALDFKNHTGSTTLTDEQKRIASQTVLTVNAKGGNAITGVTLENLSAKLEQWAPTITGKETLANIYTLMPIWEVAKDSNRKAALQKYFSDSVNTQNAYLSNYFKKEEFFVNGGTYEIEFHAIPENYITCWYAGETGSTLGIGKRENNTDAINALRWKAIKSNSYPDYFSFQNVNSGMMITSSIKAGYADGHYVFLTNADGSDAQLFKPIQYDDKSVILTSKIQCGNGLPCYYVASSGKLNDLVGLEYEQQPQYYSAFKWKFHRIN